MHIECVLCGLHITCSSHLDVRYSGGQSSRPSRPRRLVAQVEPQKCTRATRLVNPSRDIAMPSAQGQGFLRAVPKPPSRALSASCFRNQIPKRRGSSHRSCASASSEICQVASNFYDYHRACPQHGRLSLSRPELGVSGFRDTVGSSGLDAQRRVHYPISDSPFARQPLAPEHVQQLNIVEDSEQVPPILRMTDIAIRASSATWALLRIRVPIFSVHSRFHLGGPPVTLV